MNSRLASELAHELISYNTCSDSCDPRFYSFFENKLKQLGYQIKITEIDGVKHYAATISPNSNPRLKIAFVGHYDTVVFNSSYWKHNPLGTIDGDTLYGRGASDMKSGVAAMLCAGVTLAKDGIQSTVFIPGDEETKSKGMPALLELGTDFDYAIGGEPTSKTKLGDTLKVGRRGLMQGILTLYGQSGHAAYASMVDNVNNDIGKFIQCLVEPWDDLYCGVCSTVSITGVSSDSGANNVIPDIVKIKFDARFSPLHTLTEFEALFKSRLARQTRQWDINILSSTPPYGQHHPNSMKLTEAAVAVIKSELGLDPIISCDGGTSDARFLAFKNIPTIEFGVPHGNMHGNDEFVKLKYVDQLQGIFEKIVGRLE